MPDDGGVERFYDRLADHYHLIFEDWPAGRRWQADVLLPALEAAAGGPIRTLTDATCGIGTQALAVAERGIAVAAFSAAGLAGVRWIGPEESGYYQPVVVGTRP